MRFQPTTLDLLSPLHTDLVVLLEEPKPFAHNFARVVVERFRQADSALSRMHGGLKLGLAICRHLVKAHGGRISATSPGKDAGTTIRIELPLHMVPDDSQADAFARDLLI